MPKQYINKTEEELLNRKFCNFIYSNNNAPAIRNNLFKEISKYKQVDSWGKVLNNMGMLSPNKLDTQSQYKFSIACENALYYGYTTEKIIDPFIARSVPIYWGNPDIASEFNEKAFINVHNFKTLEELTKYIKSIDEDDNKYIDMLNEGLTILPPPTKKANSNSKSKINIQKTCFIKSPTEIKNDLEKFILNMFNQPIEEAYRAPRQSFFIKKYEKLYTDGCEATHIEKNPLKWILFAKSNTNVIYIQILGIKLYLQNILIGLRIFINKFFDIRFKKDSIIKLFGITIYKRSIKK